MKTKNKALAEPSAVKALAALAQVQRLRVFKALVVAGPDGLNPGVIAALLKLPNSALSFHLKALAHSGLASCEQQGRHLVYRADFEQTAALVAYLTEHCCQGASCAATAAVTQ